MVEDTRACLKRFYRNYQSILGNHHISEMMEYIDQFEYHPLMCYTLVNTCLEKTDKHIFTHQQLPLSIALLDKHSKEYRRASFLHRIRYKLARRDMHAEFDWIYEGKREEHCPIMAFYVQKSINRIHKSYRKHELN
jgi:hypothetical protein